MRQLRQEVCEINQMLPKSGLVTIHSGNASGIDRRTGRVYIKPSGINYDILTPDLLVEVDLKSGFIINSQMRPSVDLPHHLYLYRNCPEINAIVHTHSNHATAFAACHRAIPIYLTAIADEFGCEIPCAPFAECDEYSLGESILRHRTKAPAILLANHGVFAWGATPAAAFKSAAMIEDVAKTVLLAESVGEPKQIPRDAAARYYDRYQNRYGQRKAA